MIKLKADITWNHCVNSNSSTPTPINIITDAEKNLNENPNENPENINDEEESDDDDDDDDDDEEVDSAYFEKEFDDYLQRWAEMPEEANKFQNVDDEIGMTVDSIIHPAIDPNAKWNLDSLFKELELPF